VPATVTSLISRESIEDLNLTVGDVVTVLVKSTSVMIGKEEEPKKIKK
jgi:molybdopterin-binding protein